MATISNSTGGLVGNTKVKFMEVDELSEEQLRKIAELSGRESHELALSQLKSGYDRNAAANAKSKSRVESDYGYTAAAIEDAFGVKREELADYALSRGMGRSSYALDMQEKTYEDERSNVLSALREKQRRIEDLDDELETLTAVLAEGGDKLSRSRLDAIDGMVVKLKSEQDKAVRDAIQYNNTLMLELERLSIEQQKLAAQLEAQNAKSSSKGGSGGSGGSDGDADYNAAIMRRWYELTDAGKIRYFSQNSANIRLNSYPLYQDLKRQYDELKKTTVSMNPSYGNGTNNSYYTGGR